MAKKSTKFMRFFKRGLSMFTIGSLIISAAPLSLAAEETAKEPLLKAGSISVNAENFTKGGPFPAKTANSDNFRIPALVTLENGELVAAADARYDRISADGSAPDGGGLDTIASVSGDGGKTWYYSFPIYFPDSAQNAATAATTIIDPALIVGPDNTVYCIADVNPTGVTTMNGYRSPGHGTGYVRIQGKWRLALTTEYETKAKIRPDSENAGYEYYAGDFTDGYAPVLHMDDGSPSEYCIDEWFNLYSVEDDGTLTELTQTQVDSDTVIQQNVFYGGSRLHVYETGYLLMVSSTDNGRTWKNPTVLNTQIKRPDDENDKAILVSPGKGITTKSGDIAVGFYNWKPGRESASIMYSTDNALTWHRTQDMETVPDTEIDTSSENEIVELEDGTLRMFFRHGGYVAPVGNLCYVDAKKQPDGSYQFGTAVQTEIPIHKGCNLSALSYSRKIDGKQVILVSAPSAVRANGQILTLLVNDDDAKSLDCIQRFSVPGGQGDYGTFVYSCLSELDDGSIGLLWEPSHRAINYSRFRIDDFGVISPYSSAIDVTVGKDEVYTQEDYAGEKNITAQPDEDIASVSFSETTLTITGTGEGYTTAVIDGITYNICVTEEHPAPDPDCSHSSTILKNQKDASCDDSGYTGDKICLFCNAVIEKGSVIPGGHIWDDGQVIEQVSRTKDGSKLYTCLSDDSHQKTEIIYSSAFSLFMDSYDKAAEIMKNWEEDSALYEETALLEEAYPKALLIAQTKDASRSSMYQAKAALDEAVAVLKIKSPASLQADLDKALKAAETDIAAGSKDIPAGIWSAFETAYRNASAKLPEDLEESELSKHIFDLLKALNLAQKNLDEAKKTVLPPDDKPAGDKNQTQPPAKERYVHVKGVEYKILNSAKKTAAAVSCTNKKASKITVLPAVQIGKENYKIIQINANVFKGMKNLTSVTIGKNISKIDKNAFFNCKKLKTVTFKGSSIPKIGSGAFKKTPSKITVKVPKSLKKGAKSKNFRKKLTKSGMSKNLKIR